MTYPEKKKKKHISMQERWSPSSNSISENESDERRGRLCRDQVSTFFERSISDFSWIYIRSDLQIIWAKVTFCTPADRAEHGHSLFGEWDHPDTHGGVQWSPEQVLSILSSQIICQNDMHVGAIISWLLSQNKKFRFRRHQLSEEQINLCRDIRRRGKNKVFDHVIIIFIHNSYIIYI